MSANTFPAQIEPFKRAEQGFSWSGSVPLSRFTRIAQEVVPPIDALTVQVQCRMYQNERGVACIEAELRTSVALTCQRCLEPVQHDVDTAVDLALLSDLKYADRLGEDTDFVVLNEEQLAHGIDDEQVIDLLALLEDEMLLSLPLAPRHDDCELKVATVALDDDQPKRTDNPFGILASLKGNLQS